MHAGRAAGPGQQQHMRGGGRRLGVPDLLRPGVRRDQHAHRARRDPVGEPGPRAGQPHRGEAVQDRQRARSPAQFGDHGQGGLQVPGLAKFEPAALGGQAPDPPDQAGAVAARFVEARVGVACTGNQGPDPGQRRSGRGHEQLPFGRRQLRHGRAHEGRASRAAARASSRAAAAAAGVMPVNRRKPCTSAG
ncbi:MAG TPA: hypothetical protein VKU77_39335 [Streptosporangiaceae bacterium]|nr:hypothetical protein [Streptosporangiaceae bacterium]